MIDKFKSAFIKYASVFLETILFYLSIIFVVKYREGRKAVDKLNRQTDEVKLNGMEQKIYKKYDGMSLDDLSNSSGRDSGDKSGSGS